MTEHEETGRPPAGEFERGPAPAPPPAAAGKSRSRLIVIGVIVGLLVVFAYGALLVWLVYGNQVGRVLGARDIALIRLEGPIVGSLDGDSLFGGGLVVPETIIDQLRQADEDPAIAAVLLRVNSPGGTAAASQEIHREVLRVEKPVVVSVSDVGASGAYWIAAAADRIVASPASDVGSIGVIMTIPNYSELFKKLGIELQVVAQGKFKDIGNPARPLTGEEKSILLSQSAEVYEQFIRDVARDRDLPVGKVREMATGLSFPGTEAKRLGLVDRLGNFRDAVRLAGRLGKVEGEPEIVEFGEPTVFEELTRFLGAASSLGGVFARAAGLATAAPELPRFKTQGMGE